MTDRFIVIKGESFISVIKVMTHRDSQNIFKTIEYFYMEMRTFYKKNYLFL